MQAGVFAQGIAFPTVPRGKARVRTIVTATHTRDELQFALDAFARVGRELGIVLVSTSRRLQDWMQTYVHDLKAEDLQRLFTRDTREAYEFFARHIDPKEFEGLPWHRRVGGAAAAVLHGVHDEAVAGAARRLRRVADLRGQSDSSR